MRAGFSVDAFVGKAQALDGSSANQMLLDNCGRVRWLYMAVPDGLRVHHHSRPVFALIEAEGFIDAHGRAEPRRFGQLLQLGVKLAFAIRGAGRARRIGRTGVVADKNMALKRGQAVFLLKIDDWRQRRVRLKGASQSRVSSGAGGGIAGAATFHNETAIELQTPRTHPAASAKMEARL
jgi:hypothetical protein